MQKSIRTIAILLLIATVLLSPLTFAPATFAQDRERRAPGDASPQKWPSVPDSVVRKTSESKDPAQLSDEPVMRIALSTGVPLVPAAISGTDRLLRFAKLRVVYGAPVGIDDLRGQPVSDVAQKATDRLMAAIYALEDTLG